MRPLALYSTRDWLHARPIIHGLKGWRNAVIQRAYRERKAAGQDALLANLKPSVRGGELAVTIAFNVPVAIDWLAESLASHAPNITLVVCDNSSDPALRAKIAAACATRHVPYLSMPKVPFPLQRNPSRSHGFAMTWAFYNVVRPLEPAAFAFVDHDMVLTGPLSLKDLVRTQPVYGTLADHPQWGTWALWGGYAVFDFEAVRHLPLDFGTYHTMGLDSGGRNWPVLYRHLDRSGFRFAHTRFEPVPLGGGESVTVQMIDDWMHIGEVSHRPGAAERLRDLSRRMRDAAEAGVA